MIGLFNFSCIFREHPWKLCIITGIPGKNYSIQGVRDSSHEGTRAQVAVPGWQDRPAGQEAPAGICERFSVRPMRE